MGALGSKQEALNPSGVRYLGSHFEKRGLHPGGLHADCGPSQECGNSSIPYGLGYSLTWPQFCHQYQILGDLEGFRITCALINWPTDLLMWTVKQPVTWLQRHLATVWEPVEPLQAAAYEQFCWHRDPAGDTPVCSPGFLKRTGSLLLCLSATSSPSIPETYWETQGPSTPDQGLQMQACRLWSNSGS